MFSWLSSITADVVGWIPGILAGVGSWLVVSFLGAPVLEFRKVREKIQEELMYQSNIRPPSQTTLYEGTEAEYEEEVQIFAEARDKTRRLGSQLTAIGLNWPLAYFLRISGFDLDQAAKHLMKLSIEFEDKARTISRYYVKNALKLPNSEAWVKKMLIEDQKLRREAAEQRRKAKADQSL